MKINNINYNYKNINRNLLRRYKKFLHNKQEELKVKAIGSYWTHYKWTNKDQNDWDILEKKINILNNKMVI